MKPTDQIGMQASNNIAALFVTGTLLLTLFAFFLIYIIILHRNRRNQYYVDTQRLIGEHEAREIQVRLEENERTMTQISKEVHDNIGQVSNIMRMHLHHLQTLALTEQQLFMVDLLNKLTDKLIVDTQNISHSLNGDYIKKWGLHSLIYDDLEHIKKSKEITCELVATGRDKFLDAEKELVVYRIAQESINNILKHSHATNIRVNLIFSDKIFTLKIQDNGAGFIYEEAIKKGGIGLPIIAERAKSLDAKLTIKAAPGKGCAIALFIINKEMKSLNPTIYS